MVGLLLGRKAVT